MIIKSVFERSQIGTIHAVRVVYLACLAAPTFDPELPAPFRHADPYLLASAVQKAIRRGDIATGRRAGHQLLRLDRQRLWRRLAVIALEDIGVADIDVAAELVGIATLPAARRLLGGDARALDITLTCACASRIGLRVRAIWPITCGVARS